MSEAPASLRIRRFADTDDVSALTGLLHRAYARLAEMDLRYVATWQGDDVTRRRIDRAECWVADLDGRVVGTIIFHDAARTSGCPWYDRPDVASFHQFAVEPDRQGRGIGAALLARAEERARETGAAEIALDTAAPAAHLIEYYERNGYRHVGRADWRPDVNYESVILRRRVADP